MMISTLNQQGIQQLLHEDHASAVQSFRLNLDLVRKYARTVSCCTHQHCRHTMRLQATQIKLPEVSDHGAIFFPVAFYRADNEFRNNTHEANCDDNNDDDENKILKSACFAIPKNESTLSGRRPMNRCQQCQRTVCLMSVMACYNLAVAYHCESMHLYRDQSSHVQMAIRYYRHALKLTQQALLLSNDSTNGNHSIPQNNKGNEKDGSSILLVALGNNLALLLAEIGDFEAVHECVELTLAQLPERVLLGPFLSNAVMWRLMESQPSAAA